MQLHHFSVGNVDIIVDKLWTNRAFLMQFFSRVLGSAWKASPNKKLKYEPSRTADRSVFHSYCH
ncbi:hypothetical protein XalbCFBP2523_13355 [Xanthomonas albilineans]|nr:hypothetical protein XalbCFBP2523_13355 [Xanthomonas albilineans]